MVGILIISHGRLAEALISSVQERIQKGITEVDDGEEVMGEVNCQTVYININFYIGRKGGIKE